MIEVIGFDADDTLWHNEVLYHQAKDELGVMLADYRHPREIIEQLDQTEVKNIAYYGYGIKSFTLSMIETAIRVSGGKVTAEEIDEIITIAKRMLSAPVELHSGVKATLESLSGNYALMLITKGDQFEQERKIRISGISHFFQYIEVVGEKSQSSYRKILGQYDIDPARFLMVGNSLRSDVLPVLKIGGQAVFIPNETTWFHENADQEEFSDFEFTEIENISQLPEFLTGKSL
jgi:putative hydrolase of the HAD superfamily